MDLLKLRSELSRDEGRKLSSYMDTKGFWTIGVGHLLGRERRMFSITEAECDALLDADIAVAEGAARRVLDPNNYWHLLDDVRQRALVNMAFNRGEQHMRTSTTITPLIAQALSGMAGPFASVLWRAVGKAIIDSPWGKQIGERGDRLAYMLETGKEPT